MSKPLAKKSKAVKGALARNKPANVANGGANKRRLPGVYYNEDTGAVVKTSDAAFEAAVRKHRGLVSLVARELGVTVAPVYVRLRKPKWRALLQEVQEAALDLGESVIHSAMEGGDAGTARWYLDRKGKERGYGSSAEIAITDGSLRTVADGMAGSSQGLRDLRAAIVGAAPPSE